MSNLEELKKEDLIQINGGDKGDAAYVIGVASAVATAVVFAPIITNYLFF